MTVVEGLKELGRTATNKDMRFLGSNIRDRARKEGVKWGKKTQTEEGMAHPVTVNNYPPEFSRAIYEEVEKYFLAKVHQETFKNAPRKPYPVLENRDEKPTVVSEGKPKRKRITRKKEGGNNG